MRFIFKVVTYQFKTAAGCWYAMLLARPAYATTANSWLGTDTSGNIGFSVECATCPVKELSKNLPHNQIGTTTVGDIKAAGGDVIKTSGKSPNHATVTNLPPKKASELLTPTIKNPNH